MSVHMWWVQNDGMSGHVWLGPRELDLLRQEMLLQGMAESFPVEKLEPEEESRITPEEIEGALAIAEENPTALPDPKLWRDWLAFLEGASNKGGLVLRS